jgi:hypothetical protein
MAGGYRRAGHIAQGSAWIGGRDVVLLHRKSTARETG